MVDNVNHLVAAGRQTDSYTEQERAKLKAERRAQTMAILQNMVKTPGGVRIILEEGECGRGSWSEPSSTEAPPHQPPLDDLPEPEDEVLSITEEGELNDELVSTEEQHQQYRLQEYRKASRRPCPRKRVRPTHRLSPRKSRRRYDTTAELAVVSPWPRMGPAHRPSQRGEPQWRRMVIVKRLGHERLNQ